MTSKSLEERSYIISESSLQIVFAGDNSIDASLLSESLSNIVDLYNDASGEMPSDAHSRLIINSISTGSFVIDFSAILNVLPIIQDAVEYSAIVVGLVVGVIEIRKFIKGRKVDEISPNKETITIRIGDEYHISDVKELKLYQKKSTQDSLTNLFSALEASERDGLTLISERKTTSIERSSFKQLSQNDELAESEEEISVIYTDDTLFVVKVDLSGRSQWTFSSGKQFSASVQDESFLDAVRLRKIKIENGMTLSVHMRTTYILDSYGIPIEGKEKRIIEKVNEVKYYEPRTQIEIMHS